MIKLLLYCPLFLVFLTSQAQIDRIALGKRLRRARVEIELPSRNGKRVPGWRINSSTIVVTPYNAQFFRDDKEVEIKVKGDESAKVITGFVHPAKKSRPFLVIKSPKIPDKVKALGVTGFPKLSEMVFLAYQTQLNSSDLEIEEGRASEPVVLPKKSELVSATFKRGPRNAFFAFNGDGQFVGHVVKLEKINPSVFCDYIITFSDRYMFLFHSARKRKSSSKAPNDPASVTRKPRTDKGESMEESDSGENPVKIKWSDKLKPILSADQSKLYAMWGSKVYMINLENLDKSIAYIHPEGQSFSKGMQELDGTMIIHNSFGDHIIDRLGKSETPFTKRSRNHSPITGRIAKLGTVTKLLFSVDAKYCAVLNDKGKCQFFDLNSMRPVRDPVTSVAILAQDQSRRFFYLIDHKNRKVTIFEATSRGFEKRSKKATPLEAHKYKLGVIIGVNHQLDAIYSTRKVENRRRKEWRNCLIHLGSGDTIFEFPKGYAINMPGPGEFLISWKPKKGKTKVALYDEQMRKVFTSSIRGTPLIALAKGPRKGLFYYQSKGDYLRFMPLNKLKPCRPGDSGATVTLPTFKSLPGAVETFSYSKDWTFELKPNNPDQLPELVLEKGPVGLKIDKNQALSYKTTKSWPVLGGEVLISYQNPKTNKREEFKFALLPPERKIDCELENLRTTCFQIPADKKIFFFNPISGIYHLVDGSSGKKLKKGSISQTLDRMLAINDKVVGIVNQPPRLLIIKQNGKIEQLDLGKGTILSVGDGLDSQLLLIHRNQGKSLREDTLLKLDVNSCLTNASYKLVEQYRPDKEIKIGNYVRFDKYSFPKRHTTGAFWRDKQIVPSNRQDLSFLFDAFPCRSRIVEFKPNRFSYKNESLSVVLDKYLFKSGVYFQALGFFEDLEFKRLYIIFQQNIVVVDSKSEKPIRILDLKSNYNSKLKFFDKNHLGLALGENLVLINRKTSQVVANSPVPSNRKSPPNIRMRLIDFWKGETYLLLRSTAGYRLISLDQ